MRAQHQSETEVGYGFFNGLPWLWVDTGKKDTYSTSSMFVVLPDGLVLFQSEITEGADQVDTVTLQKIIATVAAT